MMNDTNRYGAPPAAKSAVEGLTELKLNKEYLETISGACPICQDDFEEGQTVKQLPCKHFYHPNCILPWLKLHNSCPICRFELPTEDTHYEQRREQRRRQAEQRAPVELARRNSRNNTSTSSRTAQTSQANSTTSTTTTTNAANNTNTNTSTSNSTNSRANSSTTDVKNTGLSCPRGHLLAYAPNRSRIYCDLCGISVEPEGMVNQCRVCNWDACRFCMPP